MGRREKLFRPDKTNLKLNFLAHPVQIKLISKAQLDIHLKERKIRNVAPPRRPVEGHFTERIERV